MPTFFFFNHRQQYVGSIRLGLVLTLQGKCGTSNSDLLNAAETTQDHTKLVPVKVVLIGFSSGRCWSEEKLASFSVPGWDYTEYNTNCGSKSSCSALPCPKKPTFPQDPSFLSVDGKMKQQVFVLEMNIRISEISSKFTRKTIFPSEITWESLPFPKQHNIEWDWRVANCDCQTLPCCSHCPPHFRVWLSPSASHGPPHSALSVVCDIHFLFLNEPTTNASINVSGLV